jgi:LacI family transcriptional regulator
VRVEIKHSINAYDVARKAGVSQSTVSRVLNNYPHVKEETKKKVLSAIKELNFTRDEIARSLAEKKTRTIGLIIGDITNPFYAETSNIIMKRANEQNYDVIISYTDYQNDNLDQAIQTLIGKRVDGIIIGSINRSNKKIKELFDSNFPIILYNSPVDDYEHANFVVLNNERGAYIATEHLINHGHRRIAFVSGPDRFLNLYQRHLGYVSALKNYDLPYNDSLVYKGELTFQDILTFVITLLFTHNRPTAIFAGSDQIALALMDAVAKQGLKMPKDISIVGYDNINFSANHLISLTTVSQNIVTMASLALDNLLLLIEGKEKIEKPIQIELAPELIIRKTTGPAS